MKKRNLLALLLVLTLLLAMTTGCASNQGETPQEISANPSASQPSDQSQQAELPPADSEQPTVNSEQPPTDSEQSPVDAVIDSSHLYPIYDELTDVTAFLNIAPWAAMYIGDGAQFENAKAILVAEEKTNVHLNVTWSDPDTYNEKLNLLFVGGDYPDIIRDPSRGYSGGVSGLIEDEICVDLTPYFEEYAPDYYALLESYPQFKDSILSGTDVMVTMVSYTEIPLYSRGPMVRKDMLDAINMEIPTTVSELYDVAMALKNDLGVEFAVVSPGFLTPAYNAADAGGSNMAAPEMSWLAINGTIVPAITQDSQLEWVKEAMKWQEQGLFVEDWYNPLPWYDNYVLSDRLAIANGPYSLTSDATRATALNPDSCLIYPMANVVLNEGDTIKNLNNTIGGRGDGDWCITTNSIDEIPNIISYVNWFFTDEGSTVSNFGVQGEAWEYDENGNIKFTDLILEDLNGFGSMAVYAIYTNNNDNPFHFRYERTALTYDNDISPTVYDTWLSNMTSEYFNDATLNSEETAEYNTYLTDVTTAIRENLSKFITGDLDLSEWDGFIDQLETLGLSKMQQIMQGAYDRKHS